MTNSNLNYYGITSQTIHGVAKENSYLLTVADLYYLLYGKIVHFLLIKKKKNLLYGAKRGCSTNSMASHVELNAPYRVIVCFTIPLFYNTKNLWVPSVFPKSMGGFEETH